jgi:tetratricopeptide (TPR) repeat protein
MRHETGMRAALIAISLVTLSVPLTAFAEEPALAQEPSKSDYPPLVAFAQEISATDPGGVQYTDRALKAATHELNRHPPPPGTDCAQTLGASRFAEQYDTLASVHSEAGEFEDAIKAKEAALNCMPREASFYADIAALNLNMGRIAAARAALERGFAIDPDGGALSDVRARVDFLEERWADATAQFRLRVISEGSADHADYYECLFWLAQRRAGVLQPELVPHKDDEKRTRWPMPILDTLKGDLTEAQLVETIRDDSNGDTRRAWLTEALYYVGELRLAEGHVETARQHFASVVNLRKLDYVEYGMARAELARLRERNR